MKLQELSINTMEQMIADIITPRTKITRKKMINMKEKSEETKILLTKLFR